MLSAYLGSYLCVGIWYKDMILALSFLRIQGKSHYSFFSFCQMNGSVIILINDDKVVPI